MNLCRSRHAEARKPAVKRKEWREATIRTLIQILGLRRGSNHPPSRRGQFSHASSPFADVRSEKSACLLFGASSWSAARRGIVIFLSSGSISSAGFRNYADSREPFSRRTLKLSMESYTGYILLSTRVCFGHGAIVPRVALSSIASG